jgi:hypothetical protein
LRRFLLPFASIFAALSLFSVGALAATTTTAIDRASAASSDRDELPTACQFTAAPTATLDTAGSSAIASATTIAIATAATITDEDEGRDDEARDDVDIKTGRAIRGCIAALREGGEHEIGQTVSEFAHQLNAAKRAEHDAEHSRNNDDDAPPAVSATPTDVSTPMASTASTTATATPRTTTQSRDHSPVDQHGHVHGGD